jgi:hypothetical protein
MPKVPMGIRISDVSQILDNEDIPIVSELVEILKLKTGVRGFAP